MKVLKTDEDWRRFFAGVRDGAYAKGKRDALEAIHQDRKVRLKKSQEAATEGRMKKSRRDAIIKSWNSLLQHPPHERAAIIATSLGLKDQYVRRVLRAAGLGGKNNSEP
ncbi:MAG: hypothetical protein P4L68_10840 [Methylovirgula sp.]|nr:hypothetical protein [Methylovirgula sp.]